jgi:hypothetical protein
MIRFLEICLFLIFETGPYCTVQVGLRCSIFLPQPPLYWYSRCETTHSAFFWDFNTPGNNVPDCVFWNYAQTQFPTKI